MQVIAEAGDGVTAVRLAQDLMPDIALVDVSLAGASCPRVKVIALTRHDDGSFVHRLLEAGASGYVLKQSASPELTCAIRAVAAGVRYIDSAIRGTSAVPPPSAAVTSETSVAELTTEEETVLRLIALGHTHQEIATTSSLDVARVLAIRTGDVEDWRVEPRSGRALRGGARVASTFEFDRAHIG